MDRQRRVPVGPVFLKGSAGEQGVAHFRRGGDHGFGAVLKQQPSRPDADPAFGKRGLVQFQPARTPEIRTRGFQQGKARGGVVGVRLLEVLRFEKLS